MGDLIRHKRSSTPSAVPDAADLSAGELALNTADGRLYMKKADGTVLVLAGDPWICQPIGVPFPIWTHLTGVTAPPTDNANYRYIKLTASDSYNTGVLTGESVSGSAPLVQATAAISDAGSALNGQTVRLINTERRVIRAGSSGMEEQDSIQNIVGELGQSNTAINIFRATETSGAFSLISPVTANLLNAQAATITGSNRASFDASRVARAGTETRAKNIGADYYMRIR